MTTQHAILAAFGVFIVLTVAPARDGSANLELTLRSRAAAPGEKPVAATEKNAAWDAKHTAIIVCDMWDQHWCKSAAARVNELAGPMNAMLEGARAKGVLIIHAPSTCTAFYQNTPQRKRALDAPFAKTPVPLATAARWGTAWSWPDPQREGVLPIDDSDMGCDCRTKCEIRSAWTRQNAAIKIAQRMRSPTTARKPNLLEQHKIDNGILCGVHEHACWPSVCHPAAGEVGKNVALMRDMTDTMFNPDARPAARTSMAPALVEHVNATGAPAS